MYVCVCRAITERQLRQAVSEGVCTLKELRKELGITRECGQCTSCARQCLKEAQQGVVPGR